MALTYDDILLLPQYSEIVPSEVVPRTHFARNLYLNMPVLSAAMDTVTENKVARVMAQTGGLGIIHKNMDIERQILAVLDGEVSYTVDADTLTLRKPDDTGLILTAQA